MYHILVVGGGYLGGKIAEYFHAQKQKVTVIKRTPKGRDRFNQLGIPTLVMDLADSSVNLSLPKSHFIIFALAPEERTEAAYQKAYLKALDHFLSLQKENPKPIFMTWLSSTGVYGSSVEGDVHEHIAPQPDSWRGNILLEAEDKILSSGFSASVIRLSGLYGPSRNKISAVQNNQWPKSLEDHFLHMIYAEDIPPMLPLFFKRAKPGAVYLGTDDEPVRASDFYAWLCEKLGKDFPASIFHRAKSQGRRYNNIRLKCLGIEWNHPTFRQGYETLLALTGLERKNHD